LGEKNNSYFLGLEKQRQVKKSISKLLDENNKVIKEQREILNAIKDYYEKLYTPSGYKFVLVLSQYHVKVRIFNRPISNEPTKS
jgi:HEPN domain-containing protein